MNRDLQKQPQMMVTSRRLQPQPVRIKNAETGKTVAVSAFARGDKLKSTSVASGYAAGEELDLIGYFHLFEDNRIALYALVPGLMLAYFRYSVQFSEALVGDEVVFDTLPKTIAMICLNDNKDFAYVPAPCRVIEMKPENNVIPMYPRPGGCGKQLNLFIAA